MPELHRALVRPTGELSHWTKVNSFVLPESRYEVERLAKAIDYRMGRCGRELDHTYSSRPFAYSSSSATSSRVVDGFVRHTIYRSRDSPLHQSTPIDLGTSLSPAVTSMTGKTAIHLDGLRVNVFNARTWVSHSRWPTAVSRVTPTAVSS